MRRPSPAQDQVLDARQLMAHHSPAFLGLGKTLQALAENSHPLLLHLAQPW
jgi:hypothetical protein